MEARGRGKAAERSAAQALRDFARQGGKSPEARRNAEFVSKPDPDSGTGVFRGAPEHEERLRAGAGEAPTRGRV